MTPARSAFDVRGEGVAGEPVATRPGPPPQGRSLRTGRQPVRSHRSGRGSDRADATYEGRPAATPEARPAGGRAHYVRPPGPATTRRAGRDSAGWVRRGRCCSTVSGFPARGRGPFRFLHRGRRMGTEELNCMPANRRRTLADALDRLGGMLDGPAGALNGAIRDAVREAAGVAVREVLAGLPHPGAVPSAPVRVVWVWAPIAIGAWLPPPRAGTGTRPRSSGTSGRPSSSPRPWWTGW
jgi:hypothetical protein